MQADTTKLVTLAEEQAGEFGFAQARRVRQYGIEHRLQVAGRTRNDVQHLRGRGLLLQRLGEFTGARFELLFQLDQ